MRDAAFIAKALGDIARAKGMSQVAEEAGLSRESLYSCVVPTDGISAIDGANSGSIGQEYRLILQMFKVKIIVDQ